MPAPAPAALLLLLLSIIATAANKKPVIFRWPSVLDPAVAVRPVVGCMLCVGESMRLSEHPADGDSSSLPL